MTEILLCEIGKNFHLGQALGNDRRGKCWAVEVTKDTPAALSYGGKYYRRFDSFKEAEQFALSLSKTMRETDKMTELLEKDGWEHYQGQPIPWTTTTEIHHFIKGTNVIDVVLDEGVDDETLESIRDD